MFIKVSSCPNCSKFAEFLFTDVSDWPIERTFENHMQSLRNSQNHQGCIRPPLLEVDSASCPPDILHMKKGIISKLVNQLVNWAVVQKRENYLIDEMKRNKIHFRLV